MKSSISVFLDDCRPTPVGWERAYTAQEAITYLQQGNVYRISLDHDLGEDVATGYSVLTWLEKQVEAGHMAPPEYIYIHTSNPPARQRMHQAVLSIRALYEQRKAV